MTTEITSTTQNPWIFNSEEISSFPDGVIGFVYLITNLLSGKQYYGKKQIYFKKTTLKTVTLKSGVKKKKKIRTLIDSDWKDYYGSCTDLSLDILNLGIENFRREILMFCYSLSELSYMELRYQVVNDVLLYPDKFYNSWLSARCRRSHLLKTIQT